uniref:Putative ovule protein n=1 Tax=Solanum chacoense TaxID=4108 RepID=A0A0V0GJG7_SOLCH
MSYLNTSRQYFFSLPLSFAVPLHNLSRLFTGASTHLFFASPIHRSLAFLILSIAEATFTFFPSNQP